MNADVTPMNADNPIEVIGGIAVWIASEHILDEPLEGIIGVHRRDIGVHRRFQRFSTG
jgi:hypothetical protein